MIIAFTGTRHGLTFDQHRSLEQQLSLLAPDEVRHGDCIGADAEFDSLCRSRDCVINLHPATLERYRAGCKATPPAVLHHPQSPLKRNRLIVVASDLLLAAPSSSSEVLHSGTWASIRYARKLGKRVVLILPNGTVNDSGIEGKCVPLNPSENLIQRKRAMIAEARKLVDELPDEDTETIAASEGEKWRKPKLDPFDKWEEYLLESEDIKTGTERQLTLYFKPESCDLCGESFGERRFFIDGALSDSRFGANMCAGCFAAKGTKIGWGEGQLYTQMDDDTWLMTGGFPPSEED